MFPFCLLFLAALAYTACAAPPCPPQTLLWEQGRRVMRCDCPMTGERNLTVSGRQVWCW